MMTPVDEALRDVLAGEIRAELARRNIEAKQLAEACHISVHPLYKMLAGTQDFRAEYIERIREHLRMPPPWPYSGTVMEHRTEYGRAIAELPLVGPNSEGGSVKVPVEFSGHGWRAMLQHDSSNMPHIHVGDVVVFAETSKPRFGYAHVIVLPGHPEQPIVRQIEHRTGQDCLVPLNPHVKIHDVEGDLLGIVVGWIHDDPPGHDQRINPAGLKWI